MNAVESVATKPRIYCWVNSGKGTDWQIVLAMAEDGVVLASHCSSHHVWAMHDIGITSDWKHDAYAKHYPNGFELEWLDDPKPGTHAGFDAAYALNQIAKAAAEPSESVENRKE